VVKFAGISQRVTGKSTGLSATVLKKQEVTDLINMAQRYYITVVPEIDMPGHMGAILCDNRYARFRLQGLFGITNDSVLDITSKEARKFAKG
jgi:hexosaminidase